MDFWLVVLHGYMCPDKVKNSFLSYGVIQGGIYKHPPLRAMGVYKTERLQIKLMVASSKEAKKYIMLHTPAIFERKCLLPRRREGKKENIGSKDLLHREVVFFCRVVMLGGKKHGRMMPCAMGFQGDSAPLHIILCSLWRWWNGVLCLI